MMRITDEMIEAGAKALCEVTGGGGWLQCPQKRWHRKLARVALEAALAVTPEPDNATLQKAEAKIADLVYGNAKVVAERDAAVATIERIRQAVAGHPKCDRYEEDDAISCGWKSAYASVVAALDGADDNE